MRRRLMLLTASIAILFALLSSQPPTQAIAPDCDTVSSVCRGQAQLMYEMCIALGKEPSSCTWEEALSVTNCMKNNGCDPGGN